MLHACFVRSPFARARINGIDTSAALALPGVHAVFTAADLNPDVKEAWHAVAGKDIPDTPRPPLAEGEVKFVGDPVALVVAESRYIAEDAVELVDVDYEPLPAVADFITGRRSSDVRRARRLPRQRRGRHGRRAAGRGRPSRAAAHVVDATRLPADLRAGADGDARAWSSSGTAATGELTIWASTQTPHELRAFCARLLGHPGAEASGSSCATPAAASARRSSRCARTCASCWPRARCPAALKWIEDRRENLMSAGQARHVDGNVRMAFDDDGKILAADIDFVQDVGAYPTPYPVLTTAADRHVLPRPVPGAQGQLQLQDGVLQHRGPARPTAGRGSTRRSPARSCSTSPPARWASTPSSCAGATSCAATRCRTSTPTACRMTMSRPADTFEQAVKILDHEGFRKEQARGAGRRAATSASGFSAYIEPTGAATGHLGTEGATIRMEPTGKINVYVNGGSTGNSLETTVVQLTADALGVDIDDVVHHPGRHRGDAVRRRHQGSRSGPMTAGAVNEAGTILRKQIVAMAAHRLGRRRGRHRAGRLAGQSSAMTLDKSVSFADIAYRAYYEPQQLPPGMSATLEATRAVHRRRRMIHWANATHACTCEVDVETGHVTLTRYIVSEDFGPMINPNVVEGQIAGGTVQGIGGALLENLVYDDDGNPLTTTFVDYLLPTATEVPAIEFGHIEIPGPGAGGYKGCGEGGAIGSTPAVINAINDALAPLGVTLTKLPASPAAIMSLLEGAQ